MVRHELLPDEVPPLERSDDERVHIADGNAITDVLRHLGEHQAGEIGIVLLGLDRLGSAVEHLDIVHHDRNAGIGSLVDQRAQGLGSAVVHDDAGDS